ncbi:flagellar brake protein [Bacillus songklensis]|uniref:Flagellar brake protein n=1 Tax=Bacillus songklensis TaxID=1069116 RepID=A0ABV8AXQ9_9BACI
MIKEGLLLRLEPFAEDIDDKFNSKVVEREDDRLFISYPVNEETGKTTFMLDGTQLKVSFIGKDNVIYSFQSEVIGRAKKTFPVLALRYPGDKRVIRIQRRQYVRVPASISIAIHPLEYNFEPFVTVTEDISAGGIAAIVNHPVHIPSNVKVNVWLTLPMHSNEMNYLQLQARVVRLDQKSENKLGKLSLQFLDMDERDQDRIIRFVFEQQFELKRKGLL